jgi:formyltetrahydrofolate synthetase
MAEANASTQCFTCNKQTRLFLCEGCSKKFCREDLTKRLQEFDIVLDQIENDHDQFREKLNRQKMNPNEHSLIKEINQWETDSINKIKQTAKECKEKIINHTNNKYFIEIEKKINDIAKNLKKIRRDTQFNEIDLNQLKDKLNELQQELEKPPNIKIQQVTSPLVQKISIVIGKFVIKI